MSIARYLYDFPKFAEERLIILTKDGDRVPFVLNRIQRVLWERIKAALMAGRPIRWIILKARQMGMSTFIAGLMAWVIFLRENRNAIVAAHDEDSATNLFQKLQLMYRMLPESERPMDKINNRGKMYLTNPDPKGKPGLESQIVVATADNTNIGRSYALHFFFGSEVAFWKDAKPILISAKNAMPKGKKAAGTFLFLESTAKGISYFTTLWDEAMVRGYERVFISWVAFHDYSDREISVEGLRLLEEELYDVDDPLYGNEHEERNHIIRELREWYPEESEDPEWVWEESLRRLAWRRTTIVHETESDLLEFKSEYPTVPADAFALTGESVFDNHRLNALMKRIMEEKPIRKRFRWNGEEFEEHRYGELSLYEPLLENELYIIAADAAQGVEGGDPSGALILRVSEMVVSGVYNAVVDPDTFASVLWDLGSRANWAFIIAERNEEGGARVNDVLNDRGYPNLYRREAVDTVSHQILKKVGFKTTKGTKPLMMARMQTAVKRDEMLMLDRELVKQLLSYQKLDTGYGVPRPEHDDLAICAMLLLVGLDSEQYRTIRKRVRDNRRRAWSLEWWVKQAEEYRPTEFPGTPQLTW